MSGPSPGARGRGRSGGDLNSRGLAPTALLAAGKPADSSAAPYRARRPEHRPRWPHDWVGRNKGIRAGKPDRMTFHAPKATPAFGSGQRHGANTANPIPPHHPAPMIPPLAGSGGGCNDSKSPLVSFTATGLIRNPVPNRFPVDGSRPTFVIHSWPKSKSPSFHPVLRRRMSRSFRRSAPTRRARGREDGCTAATSPRAWGGRRSDSRRGA